MEDIDGRAESSFNPRTSISPIMMLISSAKYSRTVVTPFRSDALTDDVLPLVSAFAAQSHGDARKAIDLFRGAGDLADERGDEKVREEHVRESQEEIDKDRSLKLIEGLTTQKKISSTRPPPSPISPIGPGVPSRVRSASKSTNGLPMRSMLTR